MLVFFLQFLQSIGICTKKRGMSVITPELGIMIHESEVEITEVGVLRNQKSSVKHFRKLCNRMINEKF